MKRNIKDIQWKPVGRFGGHYEGGYKRTKMKNWHTNQEARALDKLYNHQHRWRRNVCVDGDIVASAFKRFDGKPTNEFYAFVEDRTKEVRNMGFSIKRDLLGHEYARISWAWDEEGTLRAPGYTETRRLPKELKLPKTSKKLMYSYNKKLLQDHPWIFKRLKIYCWSMSPRFFDRLFTGHEITEEEFKKMEFYLKRDWCEKLYEDQLDHMLVFTSGTRRYYDMPGRYATNGKLTCLRDIFTIRDATEYEVYERNSKAFRKYFAEKKKKAKKEWRTRKQALREKNCIYEEDLKNNNYMQSLARRNPELAELWQNEDEPRLPITVTKILPK